MDRVNGRNMRKIIFEKDFEKKIALIVSGLHDERAF